MTPPSPIGTQVDQSQPQLVETAAAALAQLDLPDRFTIETLLCRLQHLRQRPLRVASTPPGLQAAPSGLWVGLATCDVVLVDASISPWYRDHLLFHEIGHMLCGPPARACLPRMPSVAPESVRRLAASAAGTDADGGFWLERLAEMVAVILDARVDRPECSATSAPQAASLATLRTLSAELGCEVAGSRYDLPLRDLHTELIVTVVAIRDAQRELRRSRHALRLPQLRQQACWPHTVSRSRTLLEEVQHLEQHAHRTTRSSSPSPFSTSVVRRRLVA